MAWLAGVGLTAAARRPLQFLHYLVGSLLRGGASFGDVLDAHVSSADVKALVDLVTMGTCSVPAKDIDASYMTRAFVEMWSPATQLQYPKARHEPGAGGRAEEARCT